jgi:exodeoxyribonuclease VII large subunit
VRVLSLKIQDYVERMSVTWVEGQVVQLTRRPGSRYAYLTLRDPDVDMSLSCSVQTNALDAMATPLTQGARVVVQAKPSYWTQRGSLSMDVRQIKPVGIGELLARVEYLRQHLLAEGLFDADRKRPLPFLPRRVGLICGRASAAEKDVVENARRRWPGLPFEIRAVAVQGAQAVTEVVAALEELDADPTIDVIVVARGGGAVEDLLPLQQRDDGPSGRPGAHPGGERHRPRRRPAVARPRGRRPGVDPHGRRLAHLPRPRPRAAHRRPGPRAAAHPRPHHHRARASRPGPAHLSGPVLADRTSLVRTQREIVETLRHRARTRTEALVHRERDRVGHLRAQARILSPQSTLDRGYAIVQHRDGEVVQSRTDVEADELVRITVADGDFAAAVVGGGS